METLFLSAITDAELRFGVRALPTGRRRNQLKEDLEGQVLPMFAGRVLDFELAASRAYAELTEMARSEGRTMPMSAGCIAATAVAKGKTVATRDTSPFKAAGLKIVDPWTSKKRLVYRAAVNCRNIFCDRMATWIPGATRATGSMQGFLYR
ncbi:MAG: VapC toxin family PIN domain ribonuclease [Albidovulum sp.]|nr:VapC toxin family PIN domain ribonuclease [Albidovulum sp.]